MENRLTRAVYDRSPFALRNAWASAFGWSKNRRRFGADYRRWAAFFRDAHTWSEERLVEFQSQCLREQVRIAAERVPYYRRRFDELGIRPGDVSGVEDLEKLPILEKSDVVAFADDLVHDEYDPARVRWIVTSGSTGTPLRIARSDDIEQMEWAFIWNRYRHGAVRGEPYATFAGLEIVPPGRREPPFWVDNWASRQRMFSIFHMSDANLPHYFEALQNRYQKYLWGYGSAVARIAEYMLAEGLSLHRPVDFFANSSEELQPRHAEVIAEAFGCDVWNRYGLVEQVASVTQYDCGHLHCDMDYAILEFEPLEVGDDGEVVAEVIGTNMHDRFFPMLRYRTGDLVVYHPDDRCDRTPGRPIRRIHGRTGRYFELPDGSRVTNISVIAKKCTRVRLMQVVQERAGAIRIRVVRDAGYDESDERLLREQFRRKLGDELELEVDYVDGIEKSRNGKYVSIVNRLE